MSLDVYTAAAELNGPAMPVMSKDRLARLERINNRTYERPDFRRQKIIAGAVGLIACVSGFGIGIAAAVRQAPVEQQPQVCTMTEVDAVMLPTTPDSQSAAAAYISVVGDAHQPALPKFRYSCVTPTTR